MKFYKSTISSRTLIFFLIVSLLPLIAVTSELVSSGNSQLLRAASTQQQIVASDLADRVDNYLGDKINQLTFLSNISADFTNASLTAQDLSALMQQDQDINSVYVLNTAGVEQFGYNKQGQILNLVDANQSASDAYKAAYFLAGKAYVSNVSYDKSNSPSITIGISLLQPNAVASINSALASNKEYFGSPSDISDVVVANYNISDLWQEVLSTKIGRGGYAYVVDGLGNLVAHPNKQFLATHQNLSKVQAVEQYRNGSFATEATLSETGQRVISTPRPLSRVGWAVIVEEPVASIYANVYSYVRQSAIIGLIATTLSIMLAIYFSRHLTDPIRKLSIVAKRLGAGELDQVVNIKTNDELQELANTFNNMSLNIKRLVNDLKANNLNLVTERTKLNRIIDSVTDGIIALNTKGEILSVNPPIAKLIDQEPAALIGGDLSQIFQWQQNDKPFRPEIIHPGIYNYSDLVLAIGQKISYLEMVVSVLNSKDNEVKTIITIRDLTQSRELNFMKLDFVAIAAHELRTPLTVLSGYLDILNTSAIHYMTVSDIESLQKAIDGSEQLRNLINKLLSIAHIERGEMEMFIEKLDIVKLVGENVHQHQTQVAQRLQKLYSNINKGDKPIYVPADSASMTEVLNNLLGNAIKYTNEKGEIQVNLYANGDKVRVEVSDNGPGIPEELRARLFTKFYRAKRSLIAGTRGTGLGLFITKTIIELHGGEIGIEPYTGQGATFYFTLPVYKPELHDKLLAKGNHGGGVHGWIKKRSHS